MPDDGQVLMFAYMNAEAVAQTLETGLAHYYSRSRGRLWRKGEESGHVQRVREILYDCDEDTLLLKVEQEVAACHTGHRSCFYRQLPGATSAETEAPARRFDPTTVYAGLGVLLEIYATIRDRQARRPEGSYVASLFAKGADQILKKMAEESAEVLLAAKGGKPGPARLRDGGPLVPQSGRAGGPRYSAGRDRAGIGASHREAEVGVRLARGIGTRQTPVRPPCAGPQFC